MRRQPTATEITQRDILQKNLQIDQSIFAFYGTQFALPVFGYLMWTPQCRPITDTQ